MASIDEIRTKLADVDEAGTQGWGRATAIARVLISAGEAAVEKRGALQSMDEHIDRVLHAAAELKGIREALAAVIKPDPEPVNLLQAEAPPEETDSSLDEGTGTPRCRVCGGDEIVTVRVCVRCSRLGRPARESPRLREFLQQ